jgi:hypothetical protein
MLPQPLGLLVKRLKQFKAAILGGLESIIMVLLP